MLYKTKMCKYSYDLKRRGFCYYPYKYRYDPVPFTRKISNTYRDHCRKIRTTQERRWCHPDKEYVRAKRNFKNIPNDWDDIRIADNMIRGWKRTKKKRQWM